MNEKMCVLAHSPEGMPHHLGVCGSVVGQPRLEGTSPVGKKQETETGSRSNSDVTSSISHVSFSKGSTTF